MVDITRVNGSYNLRVSENGDSQNEWFIRDNSNLKWMMTGGSAIPGHLHIYIIFGLAILYS